MASVARPKCLTWRIGPFSPSASRLDVVLNGAVFSHDPSPDLLNRRERQVVALMSWGLRLNDIAETLCLSRKTIDHFRQSAYDKLGIHDRVILALWGHRQGIDVATPLDRGAARNKPPPQRAEFG